VHNLFTRNSSRDRSSRRSACPVRATVGPCGGDERSGAGYISLGAPPMLHREQRHRRDRPRYPSPTRNLLFPKFVRGCLLREQARRGRDLRDVAPRAGGTGVVHRGDRGLPALVRTPMTESLFTLAHADDDALPSPRRRTYRCHSYAQAFTA
jgi:hypothetical protein